jgi:hypothetical protein
MQVPAIIITHSRKNKLLTKCSDISQLHRRFTCVHLSYSHLTSLASLFLFPFNTSLLLFQHREAVCNPRLHNDCGRPTSIFYTALNNTRSRYSFTAHSAQSGLVTLNFIHIVKKHFLFENLCNST